MISASEAEIEKSRKFCPKKILRSHKLHAIIIFIVIIDCLIVSTEIILLEIQQFITYQVKSDDTNNVGIIPMNATSRNHSITDLALNKKDDSQSKDVLKAATNILKYLSTSLLGLFTMEIIMKLIFIPEIFKKKLELIDAIIVVLTFILNICLIVYKILYGELSALFSLLR